VFVTAGWFLQSSASRKVMEIATSLSLLAMTKYLYPHVVTDVMTLPSLRAQAKQPPKMSAKMGIATSQSFLAMTRTFI
jgi:hypothetical protein